MDNFDSSTSNISQDTDSATRLNLEVGVSTGNTREPQMSGLGRLYYELGQHNQREEEQTKKIQEMANAIKDVQDSLTAFEKNNDFLNRYFEGIQRLNKILVRFTLVFPVLFLAVLYFVLKDFVNALNPELAKWVSGIVLSAFSIGTGIVIAYIPVQLQLLLNDVKKIKNTLKID